MLATQVCQNRSGNRRDWKREGCVISMAEVRLGVMVAQVWLYR